MFNRPRCRDWIPLASQQLRLRNLIRITGHNITPPSNNINSKKCQLYYSLHYNINDIPFYISEKLDSHGNGNFNWNDINSPIILKSMAQCICIKVWEHYPIKLNQNTSDLMTQLNNKDLMNTTTSSSSTIINNFTDKEQTELYNNTDNQNDDKMLFMWGVYFSGLILLTKYNNDVKFIKNSLLLQMQGGYFVSPYSLTQDTMRQQLSINYQLDSYQNIYNINDNKDNIDKFKIIGKNCDIVKTNLINNSSKISNISSSNKKKIITTKHIDIMNNDNSINNREFQINSPRTSRSCSPVRNNDKKNNFVYNNSDHLISKQYSNSVTSATITTTTTSSTTSDVLSNDLLNMLKIRYIDKKFRKFEIRQSYTLDKLLQLQKKQRQIKQCTEDAKDITEKICMKSAFCLNLELISNKGIYYQRKSNPSMGRTLNRLLFQQVHVKPEDILKAQELRCKIETAKFRSKLLLEEHDHLKNNCHKLEKKLNNLHDGNIELESWLMSCYRNLGREKDILDNEKLELIERREHLKQIQKALRQRKAQLCGEIKEIYPIERKYGEIYTINQIYLPNSDELTMVTSTDGILEVTPLSLSSALGYVAHALKMCSIVLNLPLRNPIKHEGSRSRIMDVVKEIPNTSREFPLYSRTIPPPKPVLYAVYLLNQNIAQLNVQANGIMRCDLRMILSNLLLLLNGPKTMGNFLLQLPNCDEYSNNLETTSVSNSSVDLNVVPVPSICSSKPVDVVDMKINEQRISRSVGSYSDDQLSANDKGFYNSEPMLTTHPVAVHLTNFADNGNI